MGPFIPIPTHQPTALQDRLYFQKSVYHYLSRRVPATDN